MQNGGGTPERSSHVNGITRQTEGKMGLSDLEPVLAVSVQALESQIRKTYCSLVKDERMYELELYRAHTLCAMYVAMHVLPCG